MYLTSMHLGTASGDRPLDAKPLGTRSNYLINVASYQNGIGYGRWTLMARKPVSSNPSDEAAQ